MPKFPNAEFLELFFQEVDSYIPEIQQGLEVLSSDRTALTAIQELHRLFHNIKGAASQVQLADLSKGAKVVELALESSLEEEQPISDEYLAALNLTAELLVKYCKNKKHHPGKEHNFHQQIVALFSKPQEEDGINEKGKIIDEWQDYLENVRSIFPLLIELAGCLTQDCSDKDHNTAVYGKLSHAVSLLSSTVLATGMKQQSRLMQDFHFLVEKLHSAAIPHQPEMSGLMQDFLRFLEVIFSYDDPENSTTIKRVKGQLQRFESLLEALSLKEKIALDEGSIDFDEVDIFDDSTTDDDSIDLFEDFVDSDFIAEEIDGDSAEFDGDEPFAQSLETAEREDSEESEDVQLDEDQLLLMEIFREECDEHLIVINQSLNFLENKVKEQSVLTPGLQASVSDMRRAVHTLKGAASMTGVNLLAKAAHSLEDMLDWLHDDAGEINPQEVQVLATGIDVIELLSQTPQATESASLDKLVCAIDEYLKSRSDEASLEDKSSEELLSNLIAEVPSVEPVPAGGVVLAESAVEEKIPAALPSDSGTLRVRLEDLDELVSIEGELVVARGAMAKMVDEFSQTLVELENVKENLRRKSQELESGFEVQSLYGFNPITGKGGLDEPVDSELSDFDPIELDRYSQLNLIIRSLNEISVDVNSIHTTLNSLAGDIKGQVGKQQLTMRLMQDKLMRIRMTPLSSISRVLFRTVRDTATKLGKKVVLTVTGEDVYMDRFVWTKITDPLMHILRNGVDHGVESPELRATADKPETATINIQAEQHSRFVVLRISDDGGGINLSLIKEKIKREGLAEKPETLSEKELLEYLFHPSFTTRQDITTISGRGVGLDVVRRNIQDLRGAVQIHNNPGQGVVFEIQIPFTLSVNRAAMVSVAGRDFAVPLQDILQVKHFSTREIEETEGISLKFGDAFVPVMNLGFHLQLEKKMDTLPAGTDGILAILFLKGEKQYAVAIDSVIEQREIIVKNLGSHLTNVRGISGVTLTGSGGLIPILNLRELVEIDRLDMIVDSEPLQMELNEPLKVLIVDDSISVRHSVARLVESQDWKQQQAVDGLDALAKLESFFPDVIILDIEMPRMNGYEFKSSLNNQEMYKDIPVVMLTSRASEKHQQKARDLGVENYLTKPYQDDTFVQLLENIRSGS
ncbi:MAG: response regulator [Desulfobulbaceae bacterium]|nr:response regulator [Desulfobulbaceae bacterium]